MEQSEVKENVVDVYEELEQAYLAMDTEEFLEIVRDAFVTI